MEEPRFTEYDPFAWLYNQHWGGFAKLVLPVLENLALNELVPGSRILEVCCGTGQLAALLTAQGYAVTGQDGSAEMLEIARENAPQAVFVLGDARSFALPAAFDAAVSTFDSLNHILELEELEAAFGCVARALKPGAPFCFDLNMEGAFLEGWEGSYGEAYEDHAFVRSGSYDAEKHLGRFDAAIFRLVDGAWQRSDVTFLQRWYQRADIFAALERAGFTRVRAYQFGEDRGLIPLGDAARRGFFVCQCGDGKP